MVSKDNPKVLPRREWDALLAGGRYDELSYQFLHYLHSFSRAHRAVITEELRVELTGFLEQFTGCLVRPEFSIGQNELLPYIHLNAAIAYLAASTDHENTDQWLRRLEMQGAPASKKLILYSLRNRYRPSVEKLFEEAPELTSFWYAKQFMASNLPAQRWLMDNARSLYASMPDDYRIITPNCVLAGYFAITYLDNENERPFKQKLNAAIKRSSPVVSPIGKRSRKSIAVVTKRWFRSSAVYRALQPYVESLAENYDLTLVNLAGPGANIDTGMFDSVRHFPPLRNVGELSPEQRQILEEQDWGLVYYPDIGMDVETVYLANQRLAPIQAMGYGHPASTHGSEIDYFIAGQEAEVPEFAEEYFSERLVLLPGIGMIPVWPGQSATGGRSAKDPGEVLINCPWTILKINADIIDVLREIIKESPVQLRFRFFSGHDIDEMGAHPVYENELKELLGPAKVELFGLINYQEFLNEMANGDLTLVAYPFGGFNTVIDSLHVGVPVVAWEGTHGYNRFPAALLKRVGFLDQVANSRVDFRKKVLHLIRDSGYRAGVSEQIKTTELRPLITAGVHPHDFRKAIEFLISNHESLASDLTRKPIIIG